MAARRFVPRRCRSHAIECDRARGARYPDLLVITLLSAPFFSLPQSVSCNGTAAAGGIGLIGTFGNIGAFFGPVLIGVLVQGSGNYKTGFAADADGFALAALVVIAVGRALASRAIIDQPAI